MSKLVADITFILPEQKWDSYVADTSDREQFEYDAMNYIRDTYEGAQNIVISEIKEII